MVSAMPSTGKLQNFLYGIESIYGTAPGSIATDFGIITGGTSSPARTIEEIEGIAKRNIQAISEIQHVATGTINTVYQHARPLYLVLGAVSHSGITPPYIHTITEANLPPSFTIVESHASPIDKKKTYTGCRMKDVTLKVVNNKTFTVDCSWTGQKGVSGTTAQAAVISTQDIFPPVECTAYIGPDLADPVTLLDDVQNISFKIENTLEGLSAINAATITQLAPTTRKYSGSLELAFETNDLYQRFLGATGSDVLANRMTPLALKVVITDGATPVNSLVITLYGVKFTSFENPITVAGIIYNTVSFTAVSLGTCVSNDAIPGASW